MGRGFSVWKDHILVHIDKEDAEENTAMGGWKEKNAVNDGGIYLMQ